MKRSTELSKRELEVLGLLSKGMPYKEIARTLNRAVGTIDNHAASIFNKLGVHNRVEAAIWYQNNIASRESVTYSSTQATRCAQCGEHKHTPLRVDWMDGYVCLTCIYKELERRDPAVSFQARVEDWMSDCFVPSLYSNMTERGDRLLEEVLELLQSKGYDRNRVATLVKYVWGRPPGEPSQEVGGVMVTLAGFCWIAGLNMHDAGETELARINQPEVMEKIRAKQEAKNALHFDTPLPGNANEPTFEQCIAGMKAWDDATRAAKMRGETVSWPAMMAVVYKAMKGVTT